MDAENLRESGATTTGGSELSRRSLLLNGATVAALATFRPSAAVAQAGTAVPSEDGDVRPFRVDVPAAEPADLRRRLAATRWPNPETVEDRSQGRAACEASGIAGLLEDGL
jgi:hypothetical protein